MRINSLLLICITLLPLMSFWILEFLHLHSINSSNTQKAHPLPLLIQPSTPPLPMLLAPCLSQAQIRVSTPIPISRMVHPLLGPFTPLVPQDHRPHSIFLLLLTCLVELLLGLLRVSFLAQAPQIPLFPMVQSPAAKGVFSDPKRYSPFTLQYLNRFFQKISCQPLVIRIGNRP